MKKALVTTSLALSMTLAVASCSSGSGNGDAAADGKDRLAELAVTTEAASGELESATWNLPFGEPASLDPILAFNYPENTVVANICEGLMMIEPDFSVTPNLAESFDTQDGQTYVYQLRQGVTFWDGSPMTAQDVAYSLNRHLDPAEGSYWASDAVSGNVESIEATSDTEVTVTLKAPDWTFNSYMATPMGVVVSEEHRKATGEAYGTPQGGVMCTGPFSVDEWQSGQSITLAKNEAYWNTDRTPKVNSLEIQFIVDPAAITNALVSGAIDGSYDVPLSAVSQLEAAGNGELILGKSMQMLAIIATGDGPLGDPAVRRALWTATDQQALSGTVFENTARPAVSLIPDGGWSFADDVFSSARAELPGAEADIEKAKEILADATADLSETITIVYPTERSYYADMISEFTRAGKEIGLDVQPQGVPSAQFGAFFSDPEARAGHGAFVTTNYMDVPDPLVFLRTIVQEGGSQNFSGYSNPEIEELLAKAEAASDETERAELTTEIEALAMADMPWLPVVDPAVRLFMSDRVTGVPASFAYLYYPWAADLGAAG
ncbi:MULTISPECIES: ABC transporter substrate-binding protein [Arthrobacter]|uniref:ABC transporter substrate-binding protein n=1 Tax=Arthrobacter TaxID=1663 RepID=UPI0006DAEC2D|nr:MULTISPECIES: ABC transporter substrate-binding protein [unclassified Arthrobacter]KPN21533.1 peptide ABC transporter substrate-binding protein [Arthrobacter sp. Edens01]MSS00356.1 ABC transporter substrate-binding protein [Arthrobacter sp. BL-252-APC-1A]